MLASITPLGERGRHRRWGITASWLVVGSALGGAALGTLCGTAGLALAATGVSTEALLLSLAPALILFGLIDFGAGGLSIVGPTRQVNDGWMYEFRGWAYGFGFGVQLGFAVATVVITPAVYGMILASVASGSLLVAVAAGTAFGLARGLTALPGGKVQQPADLAVLQYWLGRLDRPSRLSVATCQLALGVVAIVMALL
jgi:hypothetical protein